MEIKITAAPVIRGTDERDQAPGRSGADVHTTCPLPALCTFKTEDWLKRSYLL